MHPVERNQRLVKHPVPPPLHPITSPPPPFLIIVNRHQVFLLRCSRPRARLDVPSRKW
jgi:hypothetical protein